MGAFSGALYYSLPNSQLSAIVAARSGKCSPVVHSEVPSLKKVGEEVLGFPSGIYL